MDVAAAIKARHSTRLFLDKPVDRSLIEEICHLAVQAPSAINLQPWLLTVVIGEELARLSRQLLKSFSEKGLACAPEAPSELPTRYIERQKRLAVEMGPAIKATASPWADFINEGSLSFYGAPSAVIVSGEAALAHEGRLDLGLLAGFLMLACQEKGLATCPIGIISNYSEAAQEALNLAPDRPVILAVALGYADPEAPTNQTWPSRAPQAEVIRWYG